MMRGVYTSVNDIRKMVFAEVARLAYDYQDGDLSQMEQIPYRIIPGGVLEPAGRACFWSVRL